MGKSKIKAVGDVARPVLTSKNDFNDVKTYGQPDTISPIGRDPDAAGNVGTAIDIISRNSLLSKNLFSAANPYTVDD